MGKLDNHKCDDDETAASADGGNGEKGWQGKKCEAEAIFQSNRITMLCLALGIGSARRCIHSNCLEHFVL